MLVLCGAIGDEIALGIASMSAGWARYRPASIATKLVEPNGTQPCWMSIEEMLVVLDPYLHMLNVHLAALLRSDASCYNNSILAVYGLGFV